MTAAAQPQPAPDAAELARGFAAFVAAGQRLEASHRALQRRADAVDLQLAATNRALERALLEKEAVLRALPVGVSAYERDGRLVWSNPEAERLRAALGGAEPAALPTGESEQSGLCLSVQRAALPDCGTLLVVEDRTTVARLNREVARLDRLAGLSELALGIAHEIKNPLNGVMGFAALLQRSSDPDTLRRYAGRIAEGLQQVDRIVKEMLAFARAPGRDDRWLPVPDLAAAAAAAAGLPASRLTVAGDDGVRLPAGALGRVLENLLRNSVEAGDDVRVCIEVERQGDGIRVLVSDDGPGIDDALRERVLEPFVSTKNRGSGLGLALAARVIGFLGGRLTLLPDDGGGARFEIRLPAVEERDV